MNKLSKILAVAIFATLFLFAFSQYGIGNYISGRYLTEAMLKPGEKIDAMVIATGVENAYPLSAFCKPVKENAHSIRMDCDVLSIRANIAVGDTSAMMDLIPSTMDWNELVWEMSVDGHPIDLEAFGIYEVVRPYMTTKPSPVREAFKWFRLWDVVLVNPTPGRHTVQGQAQSQDGTEMYTWAVNFTVAIRK